MTPPRRRPAGRPHGFTLVEVLVALAAFALMAGMAWRGVDGMLRARAATTEAMDRTARLQTVMAQWEQDLAAVVDNRGVPALSFDGQTLRLVREADDGSGAQIVAWAVREGRWWRWASPVSDRAAGLQEAWMASQALQGNEAAQLAVSENVSGWQVFVYRGGRLTNPQSSADLIPVAPPSSNVPPNGPVAGSPPARSGDAEGAGTEPSAGEAPAADSPQPPASDAATRRPPVLREALPEGVRLQLRWADGRTLQRDIALVPRS